MAIVHTLNFARMHNVFALSFFFSLFFLDCLMFAYEINSLIEQKLCVQCFGFAMQTKLIDENYLFVQGPTFTKLYPT